MFTDQRRALDKAKRNIQECEYKLQQISKWTRELDREAMLFQASLHRLNRIVDGDLERGVAWMASLLDHLNNYVNTPAPKLPRADSLDAGDAGSTRSRGVQVDPDDEGDGHEPAIEPI